MVWNRLKYSTDPDSGKRHSRPNNPEEWITTEMKEHRIITDELWDQVKLKQRELDEIAQDSVPKRRAKYLLSNLIKCKVCGGGVSMINSTQFGCSASRNKGTCSNRKTINRVIIENAVVNAVKSELATDDIEQAMLREYNSHMAELTASNQLNASKTASLVKELQTQKARIIQAIKDGVPAQTLKDDLMGIEEELETVVSQKQPLPFKPLKSENFAEKLRVHIRSFESGSLSDESRLLLRECFGKVVLNANGTTDLELNPYAVIHKKRPVISDESFRCGCGSRI